MEILMAQYGEQNRLGGCHGGLLSTIVDVGGSLAIAAENMHSTGVSTDLNISFISGAKIGDKLTIASAFLFNTRGAFVYLPRNSRCDKIGGTLAFTSVEIKTGDKVVALGRHTKYVLLAHKANAELNKVAAEASAATLDQKNDNKQ
ncbi:hypothetical protein BGZ51_006774 [Haplosporangium sp. Z 767]|nr:hypothetical protein BGZ51_006774 [Haplosporangium sp. Z 767]KAF9190092.1 hypothetical protein BGZ50_000441 [Haplosporangium sp. Z 11]